MSFRSFPVEVVCAVQLAPVSVLPTNAPLLPAASTTLPLKETTLNSSLVPLVTLLQLAPLSVLRDEEVARARAEGVELTEDELKVAALVPWYRGDKWQHREDVPVEVALTLDALADARRILARQEVTLSSIGVYWPWVQDLKGMLLPCLL